MLNARTVPLVLRLGAMLKLIGLFLSAAMLVQVIRPIGLPGLRRRADAWKIAVIALAVVSFLSVLKLEFPYGG